MSRTARYLPILTLAMALGGCTSERGTGPAAAEELRPSEVEVETEVIEEEMAAGFDHDGQRYDLSCGVIDPELVEPAPFATAEGNDMGVDQALHLVRGVDPAVLVAVPNDGSCNLAPGQAWQSAFPASEYAGGRPSAAANAAWCTASLYGPDPAEGFSC